VSEDQQRNDSRTFRSGGSAGRGRGGGSRRPFRGGRGFSRRVKVCPFCSDKSLEIDYKQPDLLRRYLTDRGKIRPRRQTGACAKHQRRVSLSIKRARHLALLPFVVEHPRTG
jgi:small subunit ribosomal protein S18